MVTEDMHYVSYTTPVEEHAETHLNETLANIFALKILMPANKIGVKLDRNDGLKTIANDFFVTPNAVIARISLGYICMYMY